MSRTETYASDVAFSDTVKAIQARKGSRPAYARMEALSLRIYDLLLKMSTKLANTRQFFLQGSTVISQCIETQ